MKPMLLGLDFLNTMILDYTSNGAIYQFQWWNIPLFQKDELSERSCEVHALSSITIEVSTEMLVNANVIISCLDNTREKFSEYDLVIEPNNELCFPLVVGHSVIRPSETEIPVTITNFSDIDIDLEKGDLLGHIHTCMFIETDDFLILEITQELEMKHSVKLNWNMRRWQQRWACLCE